MCMISWKQIDRTEHKGTGLRGRTYSVRKVKKGLYELETNVKPQPFHPYNIRYAQSLRYAKQYCYEIELETRVSDQTCKGLISILTRETYIGLNATYFMHEGRYTHAAESMEMNGSFTELIQIVRRIAHINSYCAVRSDELGHIWEDIINNDYRMLKVLHDSMIDYNLDQPIQILQLKEAVSSVAVLIEYMDKLVKGLVALGMEEQYH